MSFTSLSRDSVLKALHIDNGILTGKECSDCAIKGLDWYKIIAIVVASKPPEVVQQALDVVRGQSGVEEYFLDELAGLLQGRPGLQLSLRSEECTQCSDPKKFSVCSYMVSCHGAHTLTQPPPPGLL